MATTKMKDKEIRKSFILRNLEFFKATTFVNELGINSRNIVDLAALDFDKRIFYGFEIKSEADNLQRLYKQLATYTTFFNITYVVAHETHTEAILALLDNNIFTRNVGYIEVSPELDFKELRKAKYSAPRFDLFIKNLDLEELSSICESKGQFMGWESKNLLVDKIKRFVTLDEVYDHMKNKIERYFLKTCPKCGSHLYYNKKSKKGKITAHCYECEATFD